MKRLSICLCMLVFACDEDESLPTELMDLKASPNPASTEVTISFYSPAPNKVALVIYNLHGTKMYILEDYSIDKAGTQNHTIDLTDFDPGNYVINVADQESSLSVMLFRE